jgi:catechol 2,3-dioxygenase-like lactoylglutathione lyase family enzyme
MQARLDHVVLWVEDPLRALDFYEKIVGLTGVRVAEFRAGQAPFPSVRIADDAIVDLMTRVAAPVVDAMAGAPGSAGHPVNHVCLAMSVEEFEALRARLEAHDVALSPMMEQSFGARGLAPRAFYFRDPDGNVLEARYYSIGGAK